MVMLNLKKIQHKPIYSTPVIKDKASKLSSMDNFRPIALASSLSKVLESVICNRLEPYLYTAANQFGFKIEHGTDTCVFALKEILDKYPSQGSTMFMCFLDASKAFGRINHEKLFNKLMKHGVPGYLISLYFGTCSRSCR